MTNQESPTLRYLWLRGRGNSERQSCGAVCVPSGKLQARGLRVCAVEGSVTELYVQVEVVVGNYY